MTENRETQQAGSPVEETEASETDVLAAVERAKDPAAADESGTTAARLDAERTDADSQLLPPESAEPSTGQDAAGPAETDFTAARGTTVGLDTEPYVETPNIDVPERLPRIEEDPVAIVAAPKAEPADARDGEIRISADHPMAALHADAHAS